MMIMTICWILLLPRRFSNVLVQWWSKLTSIFGGDGLKLPTNISQKASRHSRLEATASCTKSSIFSITQHPLTDIPSGKEWLGHVLIRTISCWTYSHDRPMIFPPYDFPTGGPTSFIWNGVPNLSLCTYQILSLLFILSSPWSSNFFSYVQYSWYDIPQYFGLTLKQ